MPKTSLSDMIHGFWLCKGAKLEAGGVGASGE
jgi:hypothetical protein